MHISIFDLIICLCCCYCVIALEFSDMCNYNWMVFCEDRTINLTKSFHWECCDLCIFRPFQNTKPPCGESISNTKHIIWHIELDTYNFRKGSTMFARCVSRLCLSCKPLLRERLELCNRVIIEKIGPSSVEILSIIQHILQNYSMQFNGLLICHKDFTSNLNRPILIWGLSQHFLNLWLFAMVKWLSCDLSFWID